VVVVDENPVPLQPQDMPSKVEKGGDVVDATATTMTGSVSQAPALSNNKSLAFYPEEVH